MSSPGEQRGQATVEVAAVLPLVAVVALAAGQLLAAGAAEELAGHAAEAGAVALSQGREPAGAARAGLPGWARDRVRVSVDGTVVRVRIAPRSLFPGASALLVADARADTR